MAVLVHHCLRSLGSGSVAFNVGDLLINAHGAVVLFFVLSGYVLTSSFNKRGLTLATTIAFYVRRAFRLLPALWCALGLSIVYILFFRDIQSPSLSPWMSNYFADKDLTPSLIVQAFMGLDSRFLPPAWTIVVEVVASVFLPFMLFIVGKGRWATIVLLLLLLMASFSMGVSLRQVPLYLVHFLIGAIAFYALKTTTLPIGPLGAFVALIVLLFFRLLHPWDYHSPVPGLVEGVASAVIVIAIAQGQFALLRNSVLMRLGDWSYSLYLVHLPVLLIIIKILDPAFGLADNRNAWSVVITFLTAALSLTVAAFFYRDVELPGMRVGKILGERSKRLLPTPVT